MSLFELVAQLIQYLTSWMPRPLLVPRVHAAAVWFLDRPAKIKTGLCVVIPLVHTVEVMDLRWDATEFEPKILWTNDGREVAIGMVLVWRISDPLKAATLVNELTTLVGEVGESVLPELVGDYTLADLKKKAAGGDHGEWALNTHLTARAKKLLDKFGMEVDYARVNFTSDRVRPLKLISGATA